MGIDARMIIRNVPRRIVMDEWLKEMSWRLCTVIGARHFFIRDGLPHSEYKNAYARWEAAWKTHALHAQYTDAQNRYWTGGREEATRLCTAMVSDVGEPPVEMRLALEPTFLCYREDGDPEPGSEYHEDSDKPMKARDGECLLEVSLAGRYYGEGYERGDILTYCSIAEWFEVHIPKCEVWYGGDSSGVVAQRFDEERRRRLRRHLYSTEGRAYFNRDWMTRAGGDGCQPPPCGMCPKRGYLGSQFGTGNHGGWAAFHCSGCGKSVETSDGGKTWAEQKPSQPFATPTPLSTTTENSPAE